MQNLEQELLDASQEILRTAKSMVKETVVYRRKPWLQNGIVICDEEHFEGFVANPVLAQNRAGVWVTIFSEGKIRGSLGYYFASTENITSEILKASYAASMQDVNFESVCAHEVEKLSFCIDIFYSATQASPLTSLEQVQECDLSKEAILFQKNFRQALAITLPFTSKAPLSPEEIKMDTRTTIKKALLASEISEQEEPLFIKLKYVRIHD